MKACMRPKAASNLQPCNGWQGFYLLQDEMLGGTKARCPLRNHAVCFVLEHRPRDSLPLLQQSQMPRGEVEFHSQPRKNHSSGYKVSYSQQHSNPGASLQHFSCPWQQG